MHTPEGGGCQTFKNRAWFSEDPFFKGGGERLRRDG